MKVAVVVAFSENFVIGRHGGIPWKLKDDMRMFKELTTGNPIIMGRKTYDSIGRPLPNRMNIVVSRKPKATTSPNLVYVSSLEAALQVAEMHKGEKDTCYVIGGAELYRLAVPIADALYISHVHAQVHGDTFFPEVVDYREWRQKFARTYHKDDRNQYPFTLLLYERR